MPSFLPIRDSALLAWAINCSTRVSAAAATFGVPTALATSFAASVTSFQTAMAACEPGVRSKSAVAAKATARTALKIQARAVANLVDGTLTVTDAQKLQLGLNVRAQPSPIPAPSTSPVIVIASVDQNIVQVKLRGSTAAKRGKPIGVNGAMVISYIGENPPADPTLWVTQGVVGRTDLAIAFPRSAEPFSKVWIAAAWFSPSKATGPLCPPVSTYLGSWVVETTGVQTGEAQQLKAA